ncbi:cytochrome P450 [Xylariomycetidae sp. FL0641]|nr:cytochrome P450 [Xylariomycetidae sp. FL0641]
MNTQAPVFMVNPFGPEGPCDSGQSSTFSLASLATMDFKGIAINVGLWLFMAFLVHWLVWVIYTFKFHPLANFPGPRLAAVSEIWLARVWLSGRYPFVIQDLHQRYGTVVRIAPNELSFNSLQAHRDIYSTPSRNKKPFVRDPKFYDNGKARALFYELDPAVHAQQRRMLAPGFSHNAMRSHESTVHHFVNQLVEKLGRMSADSGEAGVDVTEVMKWVGFDIMGELTFSENFDAVASQQTHFWISILRDSAHAAILPSLARRVPLLRPFLPFLVGVRAIRKFHRHLAFTRAQVRRRVRRARAGEKLDDILEPVIASDSLTEEALVTLTQALVIAGADTVSHALTAALYYLCTNPAALARLTREVRALPDLAGATLSACGYLSAVLEETLRCFPPIAFGLPRVSPGARVGSWFVPAGATVSASHWAVLHRGDDDDEPHHGFRPERWLADGEAGGRQQQQQQQQRGIPFSVGPSSCMGVAQAWLEMRVALAKIVARYDVRLAARDPDEGDWVRGARMYMLWRELPLYVQFQEREDGRDD